MRKKAVRVLLWVLVWLEMVLAFSLSWGVKNFGNVTLEQIVFLTNVPMEGVSPALIRDYLRSSVLWPTIILAVVLFLSCFPWSRRFSLSVGKGRVSLLPLRLGNPLLCYGLVVALVSLLLRADNAFSVFDYLRQRVETSSLIEREYVSPREVKLTFPEKKKNLVCIFIESAETSAMDEESGGLMKLNYIPELTELAREGISFSQSEKLEGAACTPKNAWTIAGLVAMTAGLPLMMPPGWNNSMSRFDSFLPGAKTLGEILEEEGYRNYFMAGSDFTFGGRRQYFTSHGNYQIYDYVWAKKEGRIPQDYKVFWGFEDTRLLEMAKEKLLEAAQGEGPFQFCVLTVDTHTPQGYVCDKCPTTYPSQYGNVWACASAQVSEFVRWIQEQDFYEDTVIFLTGDHPSMNTTFYGADTEDDYLGQVKRKVYECFLNTDVETAYEKNRRFTTLDMFPTILASLGVEIEGERLGLGTNLFSGQETLSEKMGYPALFEEIQKRSVFYEKELLYAP